MSAISSFLKMIRLYFFCHRGRERSVIARVIAEYEAKRLGIEDIVISSGGLREPRISDIEQWVQIALIERGYEIGDITPQKADREELLKQTLILGFERSHVRKLVRECPAIRDKIDTLTSYLGQSKKDIYSPSELPIFKIFRVLPFKYYCGLGRRMAYAGVTGTTFGVSYYEKTIMSQLYSGMFDEIEDYVKQLMGKIKKEIVDKTKSDSDIGSVTSNIRIH